MYWVLRTSWLITSCTDSSVGYPYSIWTYSKFNEWCHTARFHIAKLVWLNYIKYIEIFNVDCSKFTCFEILIYLICGSKCSVLLTSLWLAEFINICILSSSDLRGWSNVFFFFYCCLYMNINKLLVIPVQNKNNSIVLVA